MHTIYTIGFTQKSARQFFALLKEHGVGLVLDIRLNNKSQLAGFTKSDDLAYFLEQICGARYAHGVEFAPTKELMEGYQGNKLSREEFEGTYLRLLEERGDYRKFFERYGQHEKICLLCSEPTPEKCHRRLLAEVLSNVHAGVAVVHI